MDGTVWGLQETPEPIRPGRLLPLEPGGNNGDSHRRRTAGPLDLDALRPAWASRERRNQSGGSCRADQGHRAVDGPALDEIPEPRTIWDLREMVEHGMKTLCVDLDLQGNRNCSQAVCVVPVTQSHRDRSSKRKIWAYWTWRVRKNREMRKILFLDYGSFFLNI